MKTLILFFGLLCSLFSLSQECTKTTLYFKRARFDISESDQQVLKNLIHSMDTTKTYLIELYAYTDSVATAQFNEILSENRKRSVEDCIQYYRKTKLIVRGKSLGETNVGNPDENRRVDIYTYPLDEQERVTIRGNNGTQAKLAYQLFDGCGFCLNKPEISDVPMEKTGQLFKLDLSITGSCLNSTISGCYSAEIRIPAAQFDPDARGKIKNEYLTAIPCRHRYTAWDKLPVDSLLQVTFDSVKQEYVVHYPCYRWYDCYTLCGGGPEWCKTDHIYTPDKIRSVNTILSFSRESEYLNDHEEQLKLARLRKDKLYYLNVSST